MREAVFQGAIHFCCRLVECRDVEQRIVAKAGAAALRVQDFTVPLAFGDEGLWVFRVAAQHQKADEVGAAVAVLGKVGQQFSVVAGIGFGVAGVAGGEDARGAAECAHA